jgi:hypothetical protein
LSNNPKFLWKDLNNSLFSDWKIKRQKKIMKDSFCVHLWATTWWDKYLKDLTPASLEKTNNHFSLTVKRFIS